MDNRNFQKKEDRHENSRYLKLKKMESSCIQQTCMDTYYITRQKKKIWNTRKSFIIAHIKALHLVFLKDYLER